MHAIKEIKLINFCLESHFYFRVSAYTYALMITGTYLMKLFYVYSCSFVCESESLGKPRIELTTPCLQGK